MSFASQHPSYQSKTPPQPLENEEFQPEPHWRTGRFHEITSQLERVKNPTLYRSAEGIREILTDTLNNFVGTLHSIEAKKSLFVSDLNRIYISEDQSQAYGLGRLSVGDFFNKVESALKDSCTSNELKKLYYSDDVAELRKAVDIYIKTLNRLVADGLPTQVLCE